LQKWRWIKIKFDNYIGFRVSSEEKEKLQKRADNEHLKLASYVRWFLFHSDIIFTERPIERVRNGIPKRLVSKQITDAVKQTTRKREVMAEMKSVFEEGVQLIELSFDDLTDTGKMWKAKRSIEKLKPPKNNKI
jgi:hypothetical protein